MAWRHGIHSEATTSETLVLTESAFRRSCSRPSCIPVYIYLAKLNMMGALLDDNVAVSIILASHSDEYENLIVTMKASGDKCLVLETAKA